MVDDRMTNDRESRPILIAVGDAYERNYTGMLLQRFGYHVYSVGEGKEAVKFTSAALPRLIIAEASLAYQKDFDLVEANKEDPKTAAIPVILLLTPAGQKAQYRDAGFAAVLAMPLNTRELYQAVQNAIEVYPRANIRVAAYIQASLGKSPVRLTQYSVILSENGMFVRTTSPLTADTRLQVHLEIKKRLIKADAVILYSHGFDDYPFKELGMGMRFERMSAEDKALLRAYVQEKIEQGIADRGEDKNRAE